MAMTNQKLVISKKKKVKPINVGEENKGRKEQKNCKGTEKQQNGHECIPINNYFECK